MVKIFNDSSIHQDLEGSSKLYFYFYSPGCGPCKITSPIVENFGNSSSHIIYMVESKEGLDLQKQLNVTAYPSLIVVENKQVIKGGIGQNEVAKIIENGTSNN